MPKNKNKPNAFLYFMLEWKKAQEKKGRNFPNGLKDVQIDPDCNEEWKQLSDQEKAYYKNMEKTSKTPTNTVKRTGLGEKLSDIKRAERKEQEFKDNMTEYISSVVNAAKERNAVEKLQFYAIHVNYFYGRNLDNNEVEYYPAEIAILEFSLEKGVTRKYHEIVNEKIRLGFTSTAKDHAANTHHIPINAPFGKSNYQEIFRDICKFLEPSKENGRLPPLFTMFTKDDVYFPVKSVLSKLAAADQKTDDYLLLYSFEDLFANLHNATIEQVGDIKIEPIVATIELKKDPFAYKLGLECDFHGDLKVGVLYCSQSYAKRWIFVLCGYCCNRLGITMIPGIHMPKESNPIARIGYLNSSLSNLSLNESGRASSTSTLSMTGVSMEYRQRVSERTVKEDQRRRAEADLKPIVIIDNSKINESLKKIPEPIERPLRAPHTKSVSKFYDSADTDSIDLSESSFPCMGRGIQKKKRDENKKTLGRGYADRLKS